MYTQWCSDFKDTFENDFRIGEESILIDQGAPEEALKTPLDLIETNRVDAPDIGAYQHIIFEELEEEEEA